MLPRLTAQHRSCLHIVIPDLVEDGLSVDQITPQATSCTEFVAAASCVMGKVLQRFPASSEFVACSRAGASDFATHHRVYDQEMSNVCGSELN